MPTIVTNGLAVLGAFSVLFTTLHMVFPNVKAFQVLGMAFRQFGAKS